MRGNLLIVPSFLIANRSIPAGAGEPHGPGVSGDSHWVYPRGCGGTDSIFILPVLSIGLSPRVRGNPVRGLLRGEGLRSIPAGAGEPVTGLPTNVPRKVYPRGCGGTNTDCRPGTRTSGLSPRVRGNPREANSSKDPRRSIPAGAGEPRRQESALRTKRVYPRGCGGTW